MKATSTALRRPAPTRHRAWVKRRRSLHELLKRFDGRADDLPTDFASNHDHYLYGSPKPAER